MILQNISLINKVSISNINYRNVKIILAMFLTRTHAYTHTDTQTDVPTS